MISCSSRRSSARVRDNQRSRQQRLLLQCVGMHPVRSRRTHRKNRSSVQWRAAMSGRAAPATPSLAKGGVRPCQ